MFEQNPTEQIRKAVDARLSGLQGDPWLAQRVLANAKGEEKVKKKISVGFVLVLVIVLAAMTALAAMTLNALYERTIEMEGKNGLIQDWNTVDKVALVDWMIEAGIKLDEDQVGRLHDAGLSDDDKGKLAIEIIESYFPARDGVLTSVDIIAKEKGPIEYWSLEDKAWLSDMLAQYQPEEIKGGRYLLPDENVISQKEAEEAFFSHYKNAFGLSKDDFDLSTMTVSFGEGTMKSRKVELWAININIKGNPDSIGAFIAADGTIINAIDPFAHNWRDDWYDTFMSDAFWTIDGMCQFKEEWKPRVEEIVESGEKPDADLEYLLTKQFSAPKASDINEDTANEIANDAVMAHGNFTKSDLAYYLIRKAYTLDESDNGTYFFWYLASKKIWELPEKDHDRFIPIAVHIDAATGDLVEIKTTAGLTIDQIF